jgi:hypothetical protein
LNTERLYENIDGLFAYDTGCTDSGIKDEELRERVKYNLNVMEDTEFRLFISRYIREYYLSESSLENGYGIEDVSTFIKWLREYMDIDI